MAVVIKNYSAVVVEAAVAAVVAVRVASVWLGELPKHSGGAPTLSSRP